MNTLTQPVNITSLMDDNTKVINIDTSKVLMAISDLLKESAHKRKFDAEVTIHLNEEETESLLLDFMTMDAVYFNDETGDEIYLDNVIFYGNFWEDNNDQ